VPPRQLLLHRLNTLLFIQSPASIRLSSRLGRLLLVRLPSLESRFTSGALGLYDALASSALSLSGVLGLSLCLSEILLHHTRLVSYGVLAATPCCGLVSLNGLQFHKGEDSAQLVNSCVCFCMRWSVPSGLDYERYLQSPSV
jgi:hypothetical protein